MTVEKKKPASVKRKGKKMAAAETKEENLLTCELCKINYVTEEEINEHFWSLMHHIKIEQKQKNSPHNCTLCFASCANVLEYGKHLNDDKHKRAQEEIKRQKEMKEIELRRQAREKERVADQKMEIDNVQNDNNSLESFSRKKWNERQEGQYDEQSNHSWGVENPPAQNYHSFDRNPYWKRDNMCDTRFNEQQNYFRKTLPIRNWEYQDEPGWHSRTQKGTHFPRKPLHSESQDIGYAPRRRGLGNVYRNGVGRSSHGNQWRNNSDPSADSWPHNWSEWYSPREPIQSEETEWWEKYYTDFSTPSKPNNSATHSVETRDSCIRDEVNNQPCPPHYSNNQSSAVTNGIKELSSQSNSPSTPDSQESKRENSNSVKRRYEGDGSDTRRSSRERTKARRCMSSPSHSPSQDFLRSTKNVTLEKTTDSKSTAKNKESLPVQNKSYTPILPSKTNSRSENLCLSKQKTGQLSSSPLSSTAYSTVSSSSSMSNGNRKKKKKKKKLDGKNSRQVSMQKHVEVKSLVTPPGRRSKYKSHNQSTFSKQPDKKLLGNTAKGKQNKEKKCSSFTNLPKTPVNCETSHNRKLDAVLENAEKLCSELRDKRYRAKIEKERAEKQLKKQEQLELEKQIEELNTINRSYVKGHLSAEADKLSKDSSNSKKKSSQLANNVPVVSNKSTSLSNAFSKSVRVNEKTNSQCQDRGINNANEMERETMKSPSHTHGLRSKARTTLSINSIASSHQIGEEKLKKKNQNKSKLACEQTVKRNLCASRECDKSTSEKYLPTSSKSPRRDLPCTSDCEKKDSRGVNETVKKDLLLKMIHSPRSRKERIQLAELLKKHTKSQTRFSMPRYNFELLNKESVSSSKDVTELNIEQLPTDVQLQIAELIGKDLENDFLEDSQRESLKTSELINFLPDQELTAISQVPAETSSLSQTREKESDDHNTEIYKTSSVVKKEMTEDLLPTDIHVKQEPVNDETKQASQVFPVSSSTDLVLKCEPPDNLGTDSSSGFQSGHFLQNTNNNIAQSVSPLQIKMEDNTTDTDSTKGYFSQTIPKLNLDCTIESQVDNSAVVSSMACESNSMEVDTSIKVEPEDSSNSGHEASVESVSEQTVVATVKVKPLVSSCTSESKAMDDEDSIDEIVSRYLKKSSLSTVVKAEPEVIDTGQQSPDSSTANITDPNLMEAKAADFTKTSSITRDELEANPQEDVLAASTSSINSQTSSVSSIFDGVLKLTMKEEEIRKEINTIGDRISHLRKIIEDATHQLGRYEGKRTKLLHEEEIYRAQRLKLLQDAVNPQTAHSSSNSLIVGVTSHSTESSPSSSTYSPRKDKYSMENSIDQDVTIVDSPVKCEKQCQDSACSSSKVSGVDLSEVLTDSSKLIRTSFCQQYKENFKTKTGDSVHYGLHSSEKRSATPSGATENSTHLKTSLMFHSNGDLERTMSRGSPNKSDDSVLDGILENKLAESLENTRKIAKSVFGEAATTLYPSSIKKESNYSLPPIEESQTLESSFEGNISKRGEDVIEEVKSDSSCGSIDSGKVSLGEKIKIYCDVVNESDNNAGICELSERGGNDDSDLSELEKTLLKKDDCDSASDIFLQSDDKELGEEDTPGRNVRECSSVLESLTIDIGSDKNSSNSDEDEELRSYCPIREKTDDVQKSAFKKKLKTKKERNQSSKHKFESWMDSTSSDGASHDDDALPKLSKLKVRLRFSKNKSDNAEKAVSVSDAEESSSKTADTISSKLNNSSQKHASVSSVESGSSKSKISKSSLTFQSKNLQNLRSSMMDFMKSRTNSVKNSDPIKYKGPAHSVIALELYKGFLYVAYQNDEVRKFNLETGDCVFWYDISGCGIKCIKLLPVDNVMDKLIVGGNKLLTYDTKSGLIQTIEELEENERVHCLHMDWNTLYIGLASGNVFAKNCKANKTVDTFRCASRPIMCMTSATEGSRKLLVVGAQDAMISLMDAKSGVLIRCLDGHTKTVFALWVENQYVFSGSGDKTVMVHNLHTGELKCTYPDHKAIVTGLESSGDMLITVSYDKLIRCYDKKNHTMKQLYYGAGNDVVTSVCVHGSRLYTGNREGLVECIKFQFDSKVACKFENCGVMFGLADHLLHHIITDHVVSTSKMFLCSWEGCKERIPVDNMKEKVEEHILKHIHSTL